VAKSRSDDSFKAFYWLENKYSSVNDVINIHSLENASLAANESLIDYLLSKISNDEDDDERNAFYDYVDRTDTTSLFWNIVIPKLAASKHPNIESILQIYVDRYVALPGYSFIDLLYLRIVSQAVAAGNFELAKKYLGDPENATFQELFEMFSSAVKSDRCDIVLFCLAKGFGPLTAGIFGNLGNMEMTKLLLDKDSATILPIYQDIMFDAPNAEMIEFVVSKFGFELTPNAIYQILSVPFGNSVDENARFKALKCCSEILKFDWKGFEVDLLLASWQEPLHMRWLEAQGAIFVCDSPFPFLLNLNSMFEQGKITFCPTLLSMS
jgi:hypothetical protein